MLNLMGSEFGSESEPVSGFSGSRVDDFSSLVSHRGATAASGSSSWIKKADPGSFTSNHLLSRSTAENTSQRLDHGMTNGSVAFMLGSEGKHVPRKVGKTPRNGSGSFRKLQTLQGDSFLTRAETDDAKVELDMLGSHLVKCSNADKAQAVKHRNSINGKRGDRRNSKVQMKAKVDPFSPRAALLSFSPGAGGNNAFGMYGLKPDVHDVTKLMDDISLDELLDGSYKCPEVKDKGKKAASVNNNILDSVRKVCSLIQLQGVRQCKQTEEVDALTNKKSPSLSSPSDTNVENGSDGDGSSAADSSKCLKELESCMEAEASTEVNESPLYQPRDVLEKLALPPPKDLESLLQDAVKPISSLKCTDSRSKQSSHRISLPPFPWSHNFNGHHKSNNEAVKNSNKSTCQGRWVRISTASFSGGDTEGFLDLESLTYDDTLVPAGQVKYRYPEIGNTSCTPIGHQLSQEGVSVAVRSTSLPRPESGSTPHIKMEALHSPRVLAAARTLCDLANCSKHKLSGIMKWQKQPSQKAMKARKFRSNEKYEEEYLTPKSDSMLDHLVRSIEHGSTSKRPKISLVERREEFTHVPTVIGLSSVSAPRSNRSSPSRLSRDSVAEPRYVNGTFVKSSFMVPAPPRLLDRSNHNPQKLRKVAPMDWNRSRS